MICFPVLAAGLQIENYFFLFRNQNSKEPLEQGAGVMTLLSAQSYTFVEIDHKKNSTDIFLLPMIQEGLLSVTIKKYVHEVVNRLVKLAQEKSVVK